MKKVYSLFFVLSAMALTACGGGKTSKAASTSKKATATSKTAATSKAPESKEPPHVHTWTAGTDGANSDGKVIKNYTCACGAKAAGIALTDCVTEDAGNIAADGKIKLDSTTRWKIVAPQAGTCTLMMSAKLSSAYTGASPRPTDTAFMNTYSIKAGDTEGTVTFVGKTYEEDLGINENDSVYYEVGTLTVAQGENVISFTTPSQQYYRLCNDGEVRLVFAAAK